MSKAQLAKLRKRVYLTLPWAGAIMVAYGVTSESTAALWVGLVGALIGPVHGTLAAANVPKPDELESGDQALYRGMMRGGGSRASGVAREPHHYAAAAPASASRTGASHLRALPWCVPIASPSSRPVGSLPCSPK